ncbi:cytochrome c peroxidase [Sediminitomix flava]|uniref:Cytochrome c peroxidase n=2 Tax=Sediminitomix flava TaxID=379075 RepID=A0A315Z630_SEDFL|nr:cytochrome c peroxidase [Sediminitomix flava]
MLSIPFIQAQFHSKNTEELQPSHELNQTVKKIITDNGCMSCHAEKVELPFYAEFPVVGDLVKKDVNQALKHANLSPVISALENDNAVSEVYLAKLEKMLEDNTMPPAQYQLMHWTNFISSDEKRSMQEWISQSRAAYYATGTASKEFANEPIQPILDSMEVDHGKVALGKALYHDTRLSGDNTVSCASCHDLGTGGVDKKKYSIGIRQQEGGINAPTVYNAAFNSHQFWDGRADDLQAQAGGPPMNPVEMDGQSWEKIIQKLEADRSFTKEFSKVYPEGYSEETITEAIAEFEKTLITPNSRFDQYLKGDKDALSADEIRGYELFKDNNCATCHVGQAMGGQSFEFMGLKEDYFADRGNETEADHGRIGVTKKETDQHRFKTPTLRNVAQTAPYYHDGSVETLKEATEKMLKYQVGKELPDEDVDKIVLFLHTLTGQYNGEYVK